MKVHGYTPPTWPDGSIPKQIHLDLAVDDLDAAVAEAEALGARLSSVQPAPEPMASSRRSCWTPVLRHDADSARGPVTREEHSSTTVMSKLVALLK